MMVIFDPTNLNDEELARHIKMRSASLEVARKDMNRMEANLEACKAELRRRATAAFFDANEGLRLAVGDKLLVTEEAIAVYGGHDRDKGRVVIISSLSIEDDSLKVGFALGVRWIDLPIARRMREAYLASVQEAQG